MSEPINRSDRDELFELYSELHLACARAVAALRLAEHWECPSGRIASSVSKEKARYQAPQEDTMAILPKAVINISELELEHWKQGQFYESSDTSFGSLLWLVGLGVSYNEVPPGKSGCPFHNHHVEDELFYVVAGSGEYRFGETRHPIKAGDALGAPAGGPETAHQIINTGTTTLAYLGISTMAKTEIVEYPDSGKILAKTDRARNGENGGHAGRFRHIGRIGDPLDYWDGEPGA